MSILSDFHFLRPWWLLLGLCSLLWLLFARSRRHADTPWERVIDPQFLPYLLKGSAKKSRGGRWMGLMPLFFLSITIALAGPTFKKIPTEVGFYKTPLIVMIEMSEHMLSRDIDPSRLKRALFKLEDLLNQYKGAEVALVAFAGDAHLVVPLSHDYNTILTMAKSLSPDMMPIKGVNLAKALELIRPMSRDAHVLVMTSSNIDDASVVSSSTLTSPLTLWSFATKNGAPLQTSSGRFNAGQNGVAFSKLQEDIMQKLADKAHMSWLEFSPGRDDVDRIIASLDHSTIDQQASDFFFDQWQDLGPYVLIFAMMILLAAFLVNPRLIMLLICCVPSLDVKADILDWFLRDDQQAERIKSVDPNKAAGLYHDDMRKGSAYYRAQNYDKAVEHLSKVNSTDGHYNLGNALAHQGKIDEAINAYERALKLDEKNLDAKANKELLEKAREQQKQQQQQEQKNQQEKKDNEEKSSDSSGDASQNKSEEEKKSEHGNNNSEQEHNTQPEQPEQQPKQEEAAEKQEAQKKEQAQEKPQQEQKEQRAQEAQPAEKDNNQQELDAETRHHFQRIEQNNNSFFLQRKFKFESQKRGGR